MIEIQASIRTVQASYTSLRADYERSSVAVKSGQLQPQSSLLNPQQQKVVDQVGISPEALQKFEDAQTLIKQLQSYLDYMQGKEDGYSVRLKEDDGSADTFIAAQSAKLSVSIESISHQEETLEISATLSDNGALQSLSIDKTTVSANYTSTDLILQDSQFFSAF